MVDAAEDAPEPVPESAKAMRAQPARRRRRPMLFVLAAAILWLLGQGAAWLGSGPLGQTGPQGEFAQGVTLPDVMGAGDETPDGEGRGAKSPAPPARQDRASTGTSSSGTASAGNPGFGAPGNANQAPIPTAALAGNSGDAQAEQLAPSHEGGGQPAPLPPEVVVGMAADRFDSLLSLLHSHLAEQSLGNASAALQRLLAQALSPAQRAQVIELQARLLAMRATCEQSVLRHVTSGELLQADEAAAQLVVAGEWPAHALAAAAPALSLGDNWQRQLELGSQVSDSTPLSRNRRVRVRYRDALHYGVVASSNHEQVTVRLLSASGQTFPTVKAVACEPIDSNASEAIEMGFVAAHAGEARLARLWLLRAHLLDGPRTVRTARAEQLLQMLR